MTEEQAREAALEQAMQRAFISDAESRTNREYITEIFDAGVEYANRWTYCEDALPSEDGWYLVCGNLYTATEQTLTMALYEKGQWWALGEPAHIAVLAWRKLPDPAKR